MKSVLACCLLLLPGRPAKAFSLSKALGYKAFVLFMFFPRDDFNIKVLQAFVELHEFADLNLVQALR